MPEVKCNFTPRFVIKLNKNVYRTKLLPMIYICDTNFIQIKIYITSHCHVNIAYFFNFSIF